jgi:transposase-like protein
MSPEIIRLTVLLYVRFPFSFQNVEDLLHERGFEVSHLLLHTLMTAKGQEQTFGQII